MERTAASFSRGRSRRCRARASELATWEGAPGFGECVCVLGKERGGAGSPELFAELAGGSGDARRNCRSLEAEGESCLGGKRGKTRAVKWVWSRGGVMRPLTRNQCRRFLSATAGRGLGVEDDAEVAVGSGCQRGSEIGRGSTSQSLSGSVCG